MTPKAASRSRIFAWVFLGMSTSPDRFRVLYQLVGMLSTMPARPRPAHRCRLVMWLLMGIRRRVRPLIPQNPNDNSRAVVEVAEKVQGLRVRLSAVARACPPFSWHHLGI